MKMLVTTAFQRDPQRLAELEQQHGMQFIVTEKGTPTASLMGDADAIYGQLSADEFANRKQLRWVQSPSAGVEWLWRGPGIADSDIVVTNMRGAHAATIAEHTFAMLLTRTRGMRGFEQRQRDHQWGRHELTLSGIKGLTMGIIGFGNIGRAIARPATGLEMRVLAVDTEAVPAGEGVEEVWPLSRLNDMCREADVLAISAPITPGSRGMIGREQLRTLKNWTPTSRATAFPFVNKTALAQTA